MFAPPPISPPGVVIDHEAARSRRYIGSPALELLPDGLYVASHDFFGPGSSQSFSAVTRTFRSRDRGQSWQLSAEFPEQFWSNLFFHRGALYLMGTSYEYGRVVIRRSLDGGQTWSAPSYLREETGYHTCPSNILLRRGRLYRSFEFHPPGKWGNFEALVLSAPAKADLLDPKAWRFLPRLRFPTGQLPGEHWLEGNLVEDRRGRLLNVLRVDNVERAAVVLVDERRGELRFERSMPFPGGAKKFQIRFDGGSNLYWATANPAPAGAPKPAQVRNKLILLSSPDLENWTERQVLLEHPDVERHAFQYVDWRFDGADLVFVSRTAHDDGLGGAPRGHDANFLTFHRVADFRRLIG